MQIALLFPALTLTFALTASAADFQGLIVDRACAVQMVKKGRANTLKAKPGCSLNKGSYARSAYALITDDKKLYYFDEPGSQKALDLLKNTPDPDNLKVILKGDIKGQTIAVQTMSML